MSRESSIERARAYSDDENGGDFVDLVRRVAVPTESQEPEATSN